MTEQQSIFNNFHVAQLAEQVRLSVMTGQVLYIEGPPGVGKTQIINQIAYEMGYTPMTFMLSEMMPEDMGGIVTADLESGIAKRLVPDVVARMWGEHTQTDIVEQDKDGNDVVTNPEARRPILAFADEINNASAMMLSSCFKLLHEGVAGGYEVPPGTVFIAAGNDPMTSNVAQDLPAPLYNRMCSVKFAGPSPDEFQVHGIANSFHPVVLAFLKHHPEWLISKADFTDAGAQPTPRSWEAVSEYLYAIDNLALTEDGNKPIHKTSRMFGIAGRVGEKAGKMIEASLKYADKLIPFDEVLADPDGAKVTDEFIPAYMQGLSLAGAIQTVEQAEIVIRYVKRMAPEVTSVFVTSLIGRPDGPEFVGAFDLNEDITGINGFGARSNLGQELSIRN